jgi:hypothetical protein
MCGKMAMYMQYALFVNILYPIQLVSSCDLDKLQRFDSHSGCRGLFGMFSKFLKTHSVIFPLCIRYNDFVWFTPASDFTCRGSSATSVYNF